MSDVRLRLRQARALVGHADRTVMPATWKGLLTLVLVLGMIVARTAHEDDLVVGLPGQPPDVDFKHYAGYVTLADGPNERASFYWFFEADHPNASSLPVALWLQGGPGCSSTGSGAFTEIGPFLMKKGVLTRNKHSWNKEVNLIFLDSPVGTGFSYNFDSRYEYNDENTAVDSYEFLVGWFKKFPQYLSNDFYLLGESYAGHYGPQLAMQILFENEANGAIKINFRGFNLGNPWTDSYIDNKGTLQWYLFHSLISEETYHLAVEHCDLANSFYIGDVGDKSCKEAYLQIVRDLQEVVLENVYETACNEEIVTTNISALPQLRKQSPHKKVSSVWHHAQNPCAADGIFPYFNSAQVKAALHVPSIVNWTDCSYPVGILYSHADSVASILPLYRSLLNANIKMWIYSGDWDGNVPTTGTRAWIRSLQLPIVLKWRPWDYHSQVGGWTQVYKGLTFTTVRGAGHMVPTDQAGRALEVLRSFLAGKPLPAFHLILN